METPQTASKEINTNATLNEQIRACDKRISEYTKAIKKLNKEIALLR